MQELWKKKQLNEKIAMVSCYTAPIADICAKSVDVLLVGDTVGMTIYGHLDTKSVTLDMMINHGKAVKSAAPNSLVIVDMPYGSYEHDANLALVNAQKILAETGADAVKLEGGIEIAESLKLLKANNIKVVGHIGLLPQHFAHGQKYKVQGKLLDDQARIKNDLECLLSTGIDVIVIECVYKDFVDDLIKGKPAIFIGIGASDMCDGQVLVSDDIFGLTYNIKRPKFAKAYADCIEIFEKAITEFSKEVKNGNFPKQSNLYLRE